MPPLVLVLLGLLLLACQPVEESPASTPASTEKEPAVSVTPPAIPEDLTPVHTPVQPDVPPESSPPTDVTALPTEIPGEVPTFTAQPPSVDSLADVIAVEVSGSPGDYQFSVTVQSPDTGCDQYADWWEVLDAKGNLIYRRVLLHSHVGEQPFVRSGGPVNIQRDQTVLVRAHMSTGGYGGAAFRGSPAQGFQTTSLDSSFAAQAELQPPLPSGCAF